MRECPHNPGINAMVCGRCSDTCGFNLLEIDRRKAKINKGAGLTVNSQGLKYLKIKKG